MTEPDYKIEECLDRDTVEVYYRVYRMRRQYSPDLATEKIFDTLDEAKKCVRLLRKYKERIFHYLEEEE